MPKLKLTATKVEKLPAPTATGKPLLFWDTELTGFGVLCSGKKATRSFIVQRDLPGGRTRRFTIGHVGEVELDKAREEAADLLHGMRKGVDPKAGRRGNAAASVQDILDDYLKENKKLAENSRLSYRTSIEKHFGDWLDQPMRDITADILTDHHDAIQQRIEQEAKAAQHRREVIAPAERVLDRVLPALAGLKATERRQLDTLTKTLKRALSDKDEAAIRTRTASLAHAASRLLPGDWTIEPPRTNGISLHGKAAANAALRSMRVLWHWQAERVPGFPAWPTKVMKRRWYNLGRRDRLVPTDRLPEFYAAVDGLASRTARDYLLTLLFTGMRRRECGGLKWDDIDLINRVIHVRENKSKRLFDLPMSDFVHKLLVARRSLGKDGEFVFPSDSKNGWLAEPKFPLRQVAKVCGIDVSAHDLRRTFASVAANTPNVSGLALKRLLNHATSNDVTSGYVFLSLEELREAAQRVCDRMKALCGLKERAGGKVAVAS